ncbi:hypothetical protein [Flavobacterium restrictum]|uniref:Outer membrane protein beta-barrel domain-containing protein n=1 Tax=Flavobacterium restrictum TaxID=2594428 RepID=A0A553DUE2_9FLAO|nr:hypothetical protein [Flavobacterium restrictum]TRX36359.1 hypothetical protein FNW21_13720 [Flavobacterium restrictum]
MKIIKLCLCLILLFSLTSNAQISKGNWMMGGSANFSHNKYTSGEYSTEGTILAISPNIGYFFIDKLAIGTLGELSLTFEKKANSSVNSNYFSYGIGPFIRYYFLEKEKEINIFSEVSYAIQKINQTNSKLENFNVKTGAVYFLNSSVGLEVALNYLNQNTSNGEKNSSSYFQGKNNSFFLGVGFQIHLEKK